MVFKKKSEKTPEESVQKVQDLQEMTKQLEAATEELKNLRVNTDAELVEKTPEKPTGYIIGEVPTQIGASIIGPDGKPVDLLSALATILNILTEK